MNDKETTGPGVLDCYKVLCAVCRTGTRWHPPHRVMMRARIHATVLGWRQVDGRGWVCPRCVRRCRLAAERVRVRLPGFGKVSGQ